MSENQLITQPYLTEELKIDIKSLGEITSNMAKIKDWALMLKESFNKMLFTEETLVIAKEEKAKINKLKAQLSSERRCAIEKFTKPMREFEQLAKDTEKILSETYESINNQVVNFENIKKDNKEKELKEYFYEYAAANEVDFITYEKANINVTLSASIKSLKEKAKQFIDKVVEDVKVINLQEHKEEILHEYIGNLDINKSILTVKNRVAFIEKTKQGKKENILQAPIIQDTEKKVKMTFSVVGTKEELKKLKDYILKNGIEILE